MPHKRNPILSERDRGPRPRAARLRRSTALENQPLWHERDISHSSAERVILPDATILLDYLLVKITGLVDGLVVRPERMRENIERGLGLHASSRVLLALVERGRPVARGGVRDRPARVAARPPTSARPLRELLALEPGRRALAAACADLDACFDDARHLGHVPRGDRPPRHPAAGGPADAHR